LASIFRNNTVKCIHWIIVNYHHLMLVLNEGGT